MDHTQEVNHSDNDAGTTSSTDELSLTELRERLIQAAEADHLAREQRFTELEQRVVELEARLAVFQSQR